MCSGRFSGINGIGFIRYVDNKSLDKYIKNRKSEKEKEWKSEKGKPGAIMRAGGQRNSITKNYGDFQRITGTTVTSTAIWDILLEHTNDTSLYNRDSTHTLILPQSIISAAQHYSIFRLIMTDYNSSGVYHNFCCAGFDEFPT